MDLSLRGKRALITGGSKGIGFAIAEAYPRQSTHLAPIRPELAVQVEGGRD